MHGYVRTTITQTSEPLNAKHQTSDVLTSESRLNLQKVRKYENHQLKFYNREREKKNRSQKFRTFK